MTLQPPAPPAAAQPQQIQIQGVDHLLQLHVQQQQHQAQRDKVHHQGELAKTAEDNLEKWIKEEATKVDMCGGSPAKVMRVDSPDQSCNPLCSQRATSKC